MNEILQSQCQPGASAFDICAFGDRLIEELVLGVHSKVKSKGVAYPTCVSVNNCAGNFCPLTPQETIVLKPEDVVKIDLGVHIDGYVSTAAHTTIIGQFQNPISGRIADVVCAAYFASECAIRLLRPGKTNTEITNTIQRVANIFNVRPVQGVLSHDLSRYGIDGKKIIINKFEPDQLAEEVEFEAYQAYAIDIVMSTGEGKTRQTDSKTTIYKRNPDVNYLVKMKSSRVLLNEIKKKHQNLPFTLRSLEDQRSKLGMVELLKHDLVHAYPVLYERNGEYVAQFKFTALILPGSTKRLNEGFQPPWVSSTFDVQTDPILAQILATSTGKKKKKKKKGKTQGNNNNTQNTENQNQPPKDEKMDTNE